MVGPPNGTNRSPYSPRQNLVANRIAGDSHGLLPAVNLTVQNAKGTSEHRCKQREKARFLDLIRF